MAWPYVHTFGIIAVANRLATASATFVTLSTWTVTLARVGYLNRIWFTVDVIADARFQLTIGGVQQFTDLQIAEAVELTWFDDPTLMGGLAVLLEVRTAGAAIVAHGRISGSER